MKNRVNDDLDLISNEEMRNLEGGELERAMFHNDVNIEYASSWGISRSRKRRAANKIHSPEYRLARKERNDRDFYKKDLENETKD